MAINGFYKKLLVFFKYSVKNISSSKKLISTFHYMFSTQTSLQVNSNNLLLPWESSDQFKGIYPFYFMVTLKNNTSPKKEYTDPNRYCDQVNRLLQKGFKHIKSAFELDSKQQLHLHLVMCHDKNINRVKTSQYLKTFEPTFCHDIKPLLTHEHVKACYYYLNPKHNQAVINYYHYLFYPNDACDFIDTPADELYNCIQYQYHCHDNMDIM